MQSSFDDDGFDDGSGGTPGGDGAKDSSESGAPDASNSPVEFSGAELGDAGFGDGGAFDEAAFSGQASLDEAPAFGGPASFGGTESFGDAGEESAVAFGFAETETAEADPSAALMPEREKAAQVSRKKTKDQKAKFNGGGRKKNSRRSSGTMLGTLVTPSAVHAVLLRETEGRYGVLRQFTRQRGAFADDVPDLAGMTPEGASSDETEDVTIQFGDASLDLGSDDLFLGSEFSDLQAADSPDAEFATPERQSSPVVFELKDIIDECHAAGHEKTPVGFCLSEHDVEYVELVVGAEKASKKDSKKKDKKAKKEAKNEAPAAEAAAPKEEVKRDRLLDLLERTHDKPYENEQVAFVPMTPRDGQQRYLAVVPEPNESLTESLDLLREQSGMRSVPFRSISAEVPAIVGLARWAFPAEPHENTAVVRVGSEDTLVILLQGDTLHHTEHMRSVTAFDGPDTICSRVLLQQDVQGIGTVHHVVVLSDEREAGIVEGFSAFYPDANVSALRDGLEAVGVVTPKGHPQLSAKAVPALGTALAALMERDAETPFESVNMLPKRLRRKSRKIEFSVAWHTIVAGVLLFFAVLLFMGMYFGKQADIADAQARVDAYPDEVNLSGPALQAQIDSLQTAYVRITGTLDTIDSLLVGSDRWSRGLARNARAAASTGGAWVNTWMPRGGGLQIDGFTTSRDRIVQFAERMNATIESITFEEIRDYPVYRYTFFVPLANELPEVARYLRDRADVSLPSDTGPAPADPLEAYSGDRQASASPERSGAARPGGSAEFESREEFDAALID